MGLYKVLSRRTLYKQAKVQVDEEEIELPNGLVVKWPVVVFPDFYFGVPITQDKGVILTKEWRQGPHKIMTQFTGSRAKFKNQKKNLSELKRELKEDLGLEKGRFEKLIRVAKGTRITGFSQFYVVKDFKIGKTGREETEFQEIVLLPVKGLYKELLTKHTVQAETLLVAKILEEMNL